MFLTTHGVKKLSRDLRYGPKSQLITGTYIYTQWRTKESYYPPVLHLVLKPHPQLCPWRSRSHRISPMFMLPLSLGETQVQFFYRVLIDDLTKWLWKQVIVGDYREDDTQHYYMAKIVWALWLAAKWARCSCNDWALLARCLRHIKSCVCKHKTVIMDIHIIFFPFFSFSCTKRIWGTY